MVAEAKTPPRSTEYDSPRSSTADSFGDVNRHLQDARAQASKYVSAQIDRLKAMVRSVVLFGILGICGLAIAVTIIVTAAVLLCVGIAGGIAELLGGRQWAGDLITGGAVLAAIGLGIFIVVGQITKSARRRTIESYENRKLQGRT